MGINHYTEYRDFAVLNKKTSKDYGWEENQKKQDKSFVEELEEELGDNEESEEE